MLIPIKKLSQTAILPTQGTSEAAGWDLYADGLPGHAYKIPPHTTIKIGTGLAVAIPAGFAGFIYARSGLATNQGLAPANKVGVIDSDYRGELIVALHNDLDFVVSVKAGDRIAQMIVQKIVRCEFVPLDRLDETERGVGGFGSTGV